MAIEVVLDGAADVEREKDEHRIAEQFMRFLREIVEVVSRSDRKRSDVEEPVEAGRVHFRTARYDQPAGVGTISRSI